MGFNALSVGVGEDSDDFVAKQKSYRVGTQQIWERFVATQKRLEQEKIELSQQLTAQLTQLQEQLAQTQNQRQQLQGKLDQVTAQLTQKEQETPAQQAELARLAQERDELVVQLAQAKMEISRLQPELDQFNPPKLEPGTHREFSFNVVTVDNQGRENSRHTKTAKALIQELPGGIIIEMVAIPGGTFWMGSPDTEAERQSSESPLHQVTVSPFYLDRFSVTQAQW